MGIRLLVKLELAAFLLSLLIVFSFVQFELPFISFILPQLPETHLSIETNWFYAGTYAGTLMIPMVFVMMLILDAWLLNLSLGLYLLLGLGFAPIFFHGGGWSYLQQPTFGYIAALLPAAWIWLATLRRHPRKSISSKRYVLTSVLSLCMIHFVGGIWLALAYQMIPLEFMLSFVMPQLIWQMPSIIFIVLCFVYLQSLFGKAQTTRRHAR